MTDSDNQLRLNRLVALAWHLAETRQEYDGLNDLLGRLSVKSKAQARPGVRKPYQAEMWAIQQNLYLLDCQINLCMERIKNLTYDLARRCDMSESDVLEIVKHRLWAETK